MHNYNLFMRLCKNRSSTCDCTAFLTSAAKDKVLYAFAWSFMRRTANRKVSAAMGSDE